MPNYRNPNGYGSVVKLSGNRRRPFAVRKTVGYDERAYPIYATLGYYTTRKEAMIALAEYNQSPYNINLSKITFSELYEQWSKITYPTLKESSVSAHKAAYKYCESLYKLTYRDIRKYQMQQCINTCGKSYATQTNIRNLLSSLDTFAYDLDVIDKRYSENLTVSEKSVAKSRVIFTDQEVQKIAQLNKPGTDEILFMLYTGCRISEMLTVECQNVDLEQGILRCGVKTEAGKNRVIPIHSKLMPIIKKHMSDGKYLFYIDVDRFRAVDGAREREFRKMFNDIMRDLNMTHIPHECRHTFRSKLDSAEANKVCIDLIMGHKTGDVGERVYTHKTINELKTAIEKLSYGI